MQKKDSPIVDLEEPFHHVRVELVVSRCTVISSRTWRLDLQSPFWRLYVHSRDGAYLVRNGERLKFEPNEIYLIPSGIRFQSAATCALTQYYLHFYVTGFRSTLLREMFDRPLLLKGNSLLTKLRRNWQKGFERRQDFIQFGWAATLANAAMAVAMAQLSETAQRLCLNSGIESSPIRPALELFEKHLSDPPSNSKLAQLCRMSTDHFARRFRIIVGMTPAQYGLERRVEVAAQWLTSKTCPIEEIAAGCGFTDRAYLSRIFKARMGVSPAAFRRLHLIPKHTSPH